MRLNSSTRGNRALTQTEVLCVIVGVLLLAAIALPFLAKQKANSAGGTCVYNLKQVGLAFRVWANDNDDTFPYNTTNCLAYTNETKAWLHYYVMSNECGYARILTCPQDTQRVSNRVHDFSMGPMGLLSKTNRAVSYFVGLDADETLPLVVLSGDRNLIAPTNFLAGPVLSLATNTPFLWGRDLHTNRGNIALSDGSVHNFDRWGLLSHLSSSSSPGTIGGGLATNRLLMPVVQP
jgi:hypothetical protein